MTNKRKQFSSDSESEFYPSDTEHYSSESDECDPINMLGNNDRKKINKLRNKMKDMIITEKKILEAGFEEDEMLWFLEHIDILNNLGMKTEERYTMKMKIYNRYRDTKNKYNNKLIVNKIIKNMNNGENILEKILNSQHNDYIKSVMYKKYIKHTENDKLMDEEYFKTVEWIDNVLSIPTKTIETTINNIGDDINKINKSLNSKIYGLDNVKEKIIEAYCAMATNNEYKKSIIALSGPPGVGKTLIASAVAEAINLPFEHVSMGCIKDVNSLVGHSSTYIGAKPGIFVDMLKKMKVLNGVILLDEIDKLSYSSESKSITSTLIHILDKTQNNNFRDMYMPEITIDLSKIFFILALNDEELIDPILKDRLNIIRIDGYNEKEKINICYEYIIPKILTNLKFTNNDINISKSTIKYVIQKTNNTDNGVRQIENVLSKIIERINVLKHIKKSRKKIKLSYEIKELKFPFTLTDKHIDILMKN